MREKALGRKHSEQTILKMSMNRGYPVIIQEKYDLEKFKIIGTFVSIRKAAKILGISSNTIRLYLNSGKLFGDKYLFTS
jgi:group I intron endonuclease